MKRRTFLAGGISCASLAALSACSLNTPTPVPTTPTQSSTLAPVPTLSPPRMPTPTAFNRTSWSADPFARGARSYLGAGSFAVERDLLGTSVDDRVYFAGEATSVDNPGTVIGAVESGERVAAELIASTPAGQRVGVIGAGLAGATAARLLANAGYDVVVLEARDRVGGRIESIADPAWPVPVERGSAFVSANDSDELIARLTALGIEVTPFRSTQEIRTGAGTIVEYDDSGDAAVRTAVSWAKLQTASVSLNLALERSGALKNISDTDAAGPSSSDWLQHYLHTEVEDRYGAAARRIAAVGVDVGPVDETQLVLGNFQKLFDWALEDIDVWLSTVVTQLSYGDNGVGIRFLTGESLQVDRVAVTVPLGVLKGADIAFDPPLPYEHQLAVSSIGMGTVDKLWLKFDEPFWETDSAGDSESADGRETGSTEGSESSTRVEEAGPPKIPVWNLVGTDQDFVEWHNLEPLTGEPVLVGIIGADRALGLAKLSDEEFVQNALQSLRPFLSTKPATTPTEAPEPTKEPATG